jgi:hypothetical protein
VYTEFFGIADSSAAFGVGMTRTIEQGDPESFSPNCKAADDFCFKSTWPSPAVRHIARRARCPCNIMILKQLSESLSLEVSASVDGSLSSKT